MCTSINLAKQLRVTGGKEIGNLENTLIQQTARKLGVIKIYFALKLTKRNIIAFVKQIRELIALETVAMTKENMIKPP